MPRVPESYIKFGVIKIKAILFAIPLLILMSGCVDTGGVDYQISQMKENAERLQGRYNDVSMVHFRISGYNKADDSPITIYIVGDRFQPIKDVSPWRIRHCNVCSSQIFTSFLPSETTHFEFWEFWFPWNSRNIGDCGFTSVFNELPATGDIPAYQIFSPFETYEKSVNEGTPFISLYIPEMQKLVYPNVSKILKQSEIEGHTAFAMLAINDSAVMPIWKEVLYEDSEIVLYVWIQG